LKKKFWVWVVATSSSELDFTLIRKYFYLFIYGTYGGTLLIFKAKIEPKNDLFFFLLLENAGL
jgi:hypothetical protein